MLASQEILNADSSPDPAQILSGTLCLMSCALTSLLNSVLHAVPRQDTAAGNAFYIRRIADNLALLANDLNLDQHFRRVCKRLCEHWETKLDLIDASQTSLESRLSCTQISTPISIKPRADALAHVCAVTEALAASVRLH
jgi:hypothetical protein